MAEIQTRQFGTLTYAPEQIIHFAAGLPGFENCRDFLLHEESAMVPFLFLQSLSDTNLSFVTLPVERLEENYELTLSRDDLAQLDAHDLPRPEQILCLAILQLNPTGATANLAAPIVIAPAEPSSPRRGTQSIRQDRRYSTSHPVQWQALPQGGA
jgi:flagellar assembly factor FliW